MPDLLIRGPLVLRSADAPPLERIDLRIQAGRIVEMGRGLRGRESDRVIDAADGIVIPGLINRLQEIGERLRVERARTFAIARRLEPRWREMIAGAHDTPLPIERLAWGTSRAATTVTTAGRRPRRRSSNNDRDDPSDDESRDASVRSRSRPSIR